MKEKAESILLDRNTKKNQLRSDYAKFLGVRDVINVMINEGMYAESPAMQEMKDNLVQEVQSLNGQWIHNGRSK